MSTSMRGFKGIQTDDEHSTATTASCPISYEEQGPANRPDMRLIDEEPLNTSSVIIGRFPAPMEVRSDALVKRFNSKTTHEQADVIIPQQVVALADIGCKTINIICDDTDVFVLHAHYFADESLQCH